MQVRPWFRHAVDLAATLALAACIAVPVPKLEPGIKHGTEIDEGRLVTVVPGARKDDVLALLGPPSVIWVDRDIYGWNWGRANWSLLWATYGGSGLSDVTIEHWFLVRFDAAGTVVRAEHVRGGILEPDGEILRHFGGS